ncbi:MAG: multidrug DMT transporter permease [Legionella longbeachae]|nr:multidrug DMT transporter permease [Legionella longbeachae]
MIRFLTLISYLFIALTDVHAAPTSCSENQCIAVIDAGSTGSRLHVFAYDLDETNTATHIKEIWSKKITPGLATIQVNQSTIDTYLTTLFSEAPQQPMPVYFYATAGMRLLPQNKQKIYYQAVQNWFNQQSDWQLAEAKTISGNDEALYDWLAVNYHLDTFKSSSKEPIGVMDIGGASVQIVFPIEKNTNPDSNSQVELDLYGRHISLFVHSFLGIGQNEMTHQLLDNNSCFPDGYVLPDGNLAHGDASLCKEEVSVLINQVHKVKQEIQPIIAANHISSWYAIGGIAYLVDSKPFQFQDNQISNQDLLQQANSLICHQQWKDLGAEFPDDESIETFCLLPAFYYALMVEGYGISANQPVNYVPAAKNVDWSIGVVLYH